MAVMLDVKNINVYYGAIHAVKDISFQVNEGEIVTLIGANGAGKTTTLQTVSGLLHTRTGSIEFLGQPIQNVPASKLVGRGLAQVPEGRRVFQPQARAHRRRPGHHPEDSGHLRFLQAQPCQHAHQEACRTHRRGSRG